VRAAQVGASAATLARIRRALGVAGDAAADTTADVTAPEAARGAP
jgi:uncharacterized protein YerC